MKIKQTEQQFINNYNIHDYDIPLVSVDMAIFSVIDKELNVLLVQRAQHPAKGDWALPGGFINLVEDNTIDDAARRKLEEKTGVTNAHLEQVISIGNKSRDPRGWSVTISYMALIPINKVDIQIDASSDQIQWVPVNRLKKDPKLAFDHNDVVDCCHKRLKDKVRYTTLPVNLLPPEFTLTELQRIFELILETTIEKKSFRRRITEAHILEETGKSQVGNNRPAKLYRASTNGKNHIFSRNIEGPRQEFKNEQFT